MTTKVVLPFVQNWQSSGTKGVHGPKEPEIKIINLNEIKKDTSIKKLVEIFVMFTQHRKRVFISNYIVINEQQLMK